VLPIATPAVCSVVKGGGGKEVAVSLGVALVVDTMGSIAPVGSIVVEAMGIVVAVVVLSLEIVEMVKNPSVVLLAVPFPLLVCWGSGTGVTELRINEELEGLRWSVGKIVPITTGVEVRPLCWDVFPDV
jgi:hypothetical protein